MNALRQARRLVDYIATIENFSCANPPSKHRHLGATLADAILQAGLNYRKVVWPRVKRLMDSWPRSEVLSGFQKDLEEFGAEHMLNWRHPEKPRRLKEVTQLFSRNGLETEGDVAQWLAADGASILLEISGIGPKTVHYLMRLVGISSVAVDRHVIRFVAAAGIDCDGYHDMHKIVCFAADLLETDRSALDCAIWEYMSSPRP